MARKKSFVTASLLFVYVYVSLLLVLVERNLFSHDHVQRSSQASMFGKMTVSGNHDSSDANELGAHFRGSGSLSLLMARVLDVDRPIPDAFHDPISDSELCKKFDGLKYENRTKRRRIFAGSLIADDSWHVIGTQALETYGIFHSITFIESNRTQSFQPRAVRFESNPPSHDYKILNSGIYGPNTAIHIDNFVHETKEKRTMLREHMMRERILVKWKELGMTKEDLGIIFDMDEIPSRDVLRAIQVCEAPNNNWRTDDKQTCRAPLARVFLSMYEGSPKCMFKAETKRSELKAQFHRYSKASVVIGACIEGIGDGDKYPKPLRSGKVSTGDIVGVREEGFGLHFDYKKIPDGNEHGFFPRYNGADFRTLDSGLSISGGAGYHLHNFFESADTIRFKYRYYGHVHEHAYSVPLGAMNADMSMLVKCVHGLPDEGNRKKRLKNPIEMATEAHEVPEAFRIEGYIDARHQELLDLVTADEEDYGRADNFDGNHLFKPHMITHPGKKKNTVLVPE